jgi:26S proteasome regulatory subunit T5
MSALPPAEHPNNSGQTSDANKSDSANPTSTPPEVAEMDTTPDQPPEETWDDIPEEIMDLDTEDILTRIRLIDNDIKVCLCVRCGTSQMNFGIRSCVQSSCG